MTDIQPTAPTTDMKRTVSREKSEKLIYATTAMQLRDSYASEAASLQLIEKLIRNLKKTKHIGYLHFLRN